MGAHRLGARRGGSARVGVVVRGLGEGRNGPTVTNFVTVGVTKFVTFEVP
jgi:hypothetical protein